MGKSDSYIEKYKCQNSKLNPCKNRNVKIDELIYSIKGEQRFMQSMLKRKEKITMFL